MANTTSGSVTFDKTYAIDDIIAEAYERIGLVGTAGHQLLSAKRSLNLYSRNGVIEVFIIGKLQIQI